MQYHLVLTDERGHCVGVRSVEGHAAADREARLVLGDVPTWTPTRYPGRSWRRGEIAVFIDRRNSLLRELSVLRCATDHETAPLECPLRSLGIPALNLEPVAGGPPTPVDQIRHVLVR
jgi:hypothetical protein